MFPIVPGGYVDPGEEVRLAAIREVREECGLEIQINRLLNVYSYPGRAPVVVVFTASVVGGCLGCDDESLEAKYFDSSDIHGPSWPFDVRGKRSENFG
jgi:ADP-ribose pyrophosphatase YjhB (NUDIX family)